MEKPEMEFLPLNLYLKPWGPTVSAFLKLAFTIAFQAFMWYIMALIFKWVLF